MSANPPLRIQQRLATWATVLTLIVIVLGAYTRLSDAGLGCPDWPGCYGKLIVPEVSTLPNYPVIHTTKAWIEMIHRYVAGCLGLLIALLVLLAVYNQYKSHKQQQIHQPIFLPILLLLLVLFQALLGMWTVTLKLLPIVVMAHLLGGMSLLACIRWLSLSLGTRTHRSLIPNAIATQVTSHSSARTLRIFSLSALGVLIVQIALGGWTSANYAALVCPDFPFCPAVPFQLSEAFSMWHMTDSLNLEARITIQLVHRIGAVITTGVLIGLLILASKHNFKKFSLFLGILLAVQLLLGILNVLLRLPLPIAVGHNAVAALLLLLLITLVYEVFYTQHPETT